MIMNKSFVWCKKMFSFVPCSRCCKLLKRAFRFHLLYFFNHMKLSFFVSVIRSLRVGVEQFLYKCHLPSAAAVLRHLWPP